MFTVTKQKLGELAGTQVVVTVRQIGTTFLVALAGLLVPPFGLAAAGVTAYVYGRRLLTRKR